MKQFTKPTVVVSKCLGFDSCRYNGQMIPVDFIEKMKPYVHFVPVCPEVEIGLGVPRDPIRLVSVNGDFRLMQPTTGHDYSDKMKHFALEFLQSLPEIDGFILKGRSPSCGVKDVKIYQSLDKGPSIGTTRGFFSEVVSNVSPFLPIEDEGRLSNLKIRDHFYTSLFVLADFRQLRDQPSRQQLVQFHTELKLLLMAYNQSEMRMMGRIVAQVNKKQIKEVYDDYRSHLLKALFRSPKTPSMINVFMHALGYFSTRLHTNEKAFFLDSLEKYRAGRSTFATNLQLLRSWVIRFDEPYLQNQRFFEPYPEVLMELVDSSKGRE
ncbi:MAG TPA: DUF523 and DUF1722 domain-containing protein [Atribacter sp.]|jgi:uncharacterized protein YbgA (DUF1722 family)/uncharacterized protein YbbK (DUF523 family)|uniref:YbgA family protein n=1 Tax=Atribacter sp. TaxID=2847780 RepID=UPI002C53E8F8|nr:DUF523 and DUF1722 domain-containing protein [Atribacter sp.]HOT05438.1 DUF523 and DUF1722 domain-containing protein [Atribacter sp.]HQK83783.1 DUF523 and DUF1722 domain-containing protein [Atribacter sp.]